MSAVDYTDLPKQRLGQALEAARTMAGLSLDEAAARIGVSERKLVRWEAGKKAPGADMASALIATYGLDLGGQIFAREPIVFDSDAGGIVIADRVVRFIPGVTDNDDFLEAYVAVVRELRGLEPEEPIQLRSTDVDVLAAVLDLRDEDLESRLAYWMGQPPGSMIGVRHRLVMAAVLVGVVGTATIAGFAGGSAVAATDSVDGESAAITYTLDGPPDGESNTDLGNASVEHSTATASFDQTTDAGSHNVVMDFSPLADLDLGVDTSGQTLDFSGIDDLGSADPLAGLNLEVDDAATLDAPLEPTAEPSPADDAPAEAAPSSPTPAEPAPPADAPTEPTPEPSAQADPIPPDAAPTPAGPPADANAPASPQAPSAPSAPADAGPAPDAGPASNAGGPTDAPATPTPPADAPPADAPPADPGPPVADPAPVADAAPPAAPVVSSNFDGTREWARQNLNGEWASGWHGSGVALTGSELWQAATGDTSIDMNANGPGTLSRTIDTEAGVHYEISFELSGNPHGQRGVKTLDVSADGETGSFSTNTVGISRNNMQWQTVTMDFVATGTTADISFLSTTPGAVGAVIDHITITPIG